ncbi:hypothetical protein [Longimycelium tulufanense]|nr:hypothetical protein [Longimycelium tulufanense]
MGGQQRPGRIVGPPEGERYPVELDGDLAPMWLPRSVFCVASRWRVGETVRRLDTAALPWVVVAIQLVGNCCEVVVAARAPAGGRLVARARDCDLIAVEVVGPCGLTAPVVTDGGH